MSHKSPTIDIILPVYNACRWLPETLASLETQTAPGWRCLAVDDGSTDGSSAHLDEAARRDRRYRVIHQRNAGVSATRNRALHLSQGNFLCFLDADDLLPPDALARMTAALQPGDAWIACGIERFGTQGTESCVGAERERTVARSEAVRERNLRETYSGAVWGKLFDADWLRKTGVLFNPDLPIAEDSLFMAQLILRADRIRLLGGRPGYRYRLPEGRDSLMERAGDAYLRYTCRLLAFLRADPAARNPVGRRLILYWARLIAQYATALRCPPRETADLLRRERPLAWHDIRGYRMLLCRLAQSRRMPIAPWTLVCRLLNSLYPIKVALLKRLRLKTVH